MPNETWSKVGKSLKKVLRWIVIIFLVFLVFFIYWKYFFTYSEGYRAGLLQKFSHKGTLFKTYEGEMILSSVKSNSNVALASEKFFFSVTNDSIAQRLDTLQGEFVIVHYRQKNGKLFWKGETSYFVDGVKEKH
jgi:hypothetical protein